MTASDVAAHACMVRSVKCLNAGTIRNPPPIPKSPVHKPAAAPITASMDAHRQFHLNRPVSGSMVQWHSCGVTACTSLTSSGTSIRAATTAMVLQNSKTMTMAGNRCAIHTPAGAHSVPNAAMRIAALYRTWRCLSAMALPSDAAAAIEIRATGTASSIVMPRPSMSAGSASTPPPAPVRPSNVPIAIPNKTLVTMASENYLSGSGREAAVSNFYMAKIYRTTIR